MASGCIAARTDRLATGDGRVCWTEVDGSVKAIGE